MSVGEEFPEMINMMDQDTRTERKQVFDTQLSRRRNRLFSSLSSNIVFGIFLQNATFQRNSSISV